MGWRTVEHWQLGTRKLWLEELWDTFAAGWRVSWNGPARREAEAYTNGKFEQPPDPDRHAAREVLARRELERRKAEVEGTWRQVS